MILGFGKHKGRRIEEIEAGYLEWAAGNPAMWPWFRRAAEQELSRRKREREQRLKAWDTTSSGELPEGEPRIVCGVALDGVEAHLFAKACELGELVITPDMPLASRVPLAWAHWCSQEGRPIRVVEVACDVVTVHGVASTHAAGKPWR